VSKYYFVLDITPTTAAISVASSVPLWSVSKVCIGWVDTTTGAAATPPYAVVNQFLHDNVFSPCVI
jgi:hypothetical protein